MIYFGEISLWHFTSLAFLFAELFLSSSPFPEYSAFLLVGLAVFFFLSYFLGQHLGRPLCVTSQLLALFSLRPKEDLLGRFFLVFSPFFFPPFTLLPPFFYSPSRSFTLPFFNQGLGFKLPTLPGMGPLLIGFFSGWPAFSCRLSNFANPFLYNFLKPRRKSGPPRFAHPSSFIQV